MTKDLTPKQEKFCQLIAKGEKQVDAYREAYRATKMAQDTVYARASELANSGKIRGRILSLKAKIEDRVIKSFAKSREDILNKLESLIKEAESLKNEANFKDYIKEVRDCLKEQAKLLGYYEDVYKIKGDKDNPMQHELIVNFISS